MDEKTLPMKKIVVVIPAYQAAETLPCVLSRIPKTTYDTLERILIVEDGGADVACSTSSELLKCYPKIDVLFHEHNKGYGAAQKTGYKRALEIGADVVALLHADGQYAPEILQDLYEPLVKDEADMVLGSRMKNYRSALKGGMPLYKFVANICLTTLENLVYGMHLSEYHSGYMLYNRKALETIPFEKLSDRFHFDGEMLMVGGLKKLRIKDLPIPTHYGDEKSHLKPIQYGFEVLGIILKYIMGKYKHIY